MEKMVSLERGKQLILSETEPLASETVEIHRALHRVLSQNAYAFTSVPSARVSFRDGYAFRSQDSGPGKTLKLVDSIFAGNPRTEPIEEGEAVWIATGAVVPEGADAVIEEERVKKEGEIIELSEKVEPGLNLRAEGEEFRKDDLLLSQGTLLSSREISLLIAGGYFEVEVIRKPRLWVLAIGDELRHPGTVARPGQIYPSAGWLVAILSEELGCELVRVILVADDPEALLEAIPEPQEADLVITVGGTGFGRKDIIINSLEQMQAKIIFQGIKIRPSHSLVFARRNSQLIFSLPGRVSATEVGFELLVRPGILKLQGKSGEDFIFLNAKTEKSLEALRDQKQIIRAKLKTKAGEFWVEPLRGKTWHQEMVEADGYIILDERHSVKPGDLVKFMLHSHRLKKAFPKS